MADFLQRLTFLRALYEKCVFSLKFGPIFILQQHGAKLPCANSLYEPCAIAVKLLCLLCVADHLFKVTKVFILRKLLPGEKLTLFCLPLLAENI